MNTKLAYRSLVFTISLFPWAIAAAQATNSSNGGKTIAIVAGEVIFEDQLSSSLKGQLQRIRQQEFELKRKGLDDLVRKKLLEVEAKKKGLNTERLLQTEVDKKVADPTPGELEAYYLAQEQSISQPFEEAKASLRESLRQAKIQAARDAYLKDLRQKAEVISFLRPPQLDIKYDPQRLKGNPNAPVIIVEFSDFTCPFCRQAESTLKNLIAKYRGKVSLAYRDFPLAEIHPQAQLAAKASRCAAEQGKFWQYHDFLFSASHISDKEVLDEAAAKLGIEKSRFDICLSSNRYSAQIEGDVEDATSAGVSGTPGFFINGIFLAGLQPASAFEKVIDEQLATIEQRPAHKTETNGSSATQLVGERPTDPTADAHRRKVSMFGGLFLIVVICAVLWLVPKLRQRQSVMNRVENA